MSLAAFDLAAFDAADGAKRAELAAVLDGICRDNGFLILTGHGVPASVIANQWTAVSSFFGQPSDVKRQVAAPYAGYPYGWLGPGGEALAKSKGVETPPDLKESFNGGPLVVPDGITDPDAHAFCYQPTLWPEMAGFRTAWEAYYRAMEGLAERVMAAFAAALKLPDQFFAPYIDAPVSALRALHYPATGSAAEAGQQRAGAHSDYGSLTILLPQEGRKGLEVCLPSGAWAPVVAPPDAFVINIGDLMARWTNDAWVSTLHRVVALPDQPARQSLAYFHQPNWSAEIVPLDGSDRYPPVLSGPYLMDRFRATQ